MEKETAFTGFGGQCTIDTMGCQLEAGVRQERAPRRVALAVLLAAITSLLLVAGTASAQAEPAPTESPAPSPTPSPPDAELAAELALLGRHDAAVAAWRAVIEQGTPPERLAARLALAQEYLAESQATAAAFQLEAYLLEAPPGADVRPAQYLLARALEQLGRGVDALPLFDGYIAGGGGATAYARLDRAIVLLRMGRVAEAHGEAEAVLSSDPPPAASAGFVLAMAQGLESRMPQEALGWYERLREVSPAPADQALAIWRTGQLQQRLGDADAARQAWVAVIQRYPATTTAQTILDERPADVAIDPYYLGLVHYRGGDSKAARREFEAALAENAAERALAARASYYLAVLDERAGATDASVAAYGRVVDLDRTVEVADDALWWQGRLLEQDGRPSEARGSYLRLIAELPDSRRAGDARFRLALLDYDRGAFTGAASAFARLAAQAEDEERQRALLWQGKALAADGDDEGAETAWRSLLAEAPDEYYGLRATVLLGEPRRSLRDAGIDEEATPGWAAIEAWLRDAGGGDPSAGLEALLYDPRWGLGQELLALGLDREARAEFTALLEDAGQDRATLYQLARFFQSADLPALAARAATRLLNALPDEVANEAPAGVWQLAYPAPYVGALRDAADGEDVADVLILAIVRQESFFDPLAGSSAGALGLMQVIPPTGRTIAADLAIADFETEQLFRPALSLQFGAHYLRQQLDAFEGNAYHALAAYNGGPGNSRRWQRPAQGDVDRFVEEITFPQTRAYIELVAENLARYGQLYLDEDQPQLPRD